jgi:hypothetical protein
VLVETGAGAGAWLPYAAYAAAGARVVDRAALYADSDVADLFAPVHGLVEAELDLVVAAHPA